MPLPLYPPWSVMSGPKKMNFADDDDNDECKKPTFRVRVVRRLFRNLNLKEKERVGFVDVSG